MAVTYEDLQRAGWSPSQLATYYPQLTPGGGVPPTAPMTPALPGGVPVLPGGGGEENPVPWLFGLLGTWLAGLGAGGGNGDGGVVLTNGYSAGDGPRADVGGIGGEGREGQVGPGRTTEGTGMIAASSFRAWDPIQQRYYQLRGPQAFSNMTLGPGAMAPSGQMVTKSWVNHAWRRDGSLASTQMAMLANGQMASLSEEGRMKFWRPYRSIVIGKTLTSSALHRVSRRIKSHTKSLKRILRDLK